MAILHKNNLERHGNCPLTPLLPVPLGGGKYIWQIKKF